MNNPKNGNMINTPAKYQRYTLKPVPLPHKTAAPFSSIVLKRLPNIPEATPVATEITILAAIC